MTRAVARSACAGSGAEPRLRIENDWWVGPTVQCPACMRILKPTKMDRVPRHIDYSKT